MRKTVLKWNIIKIRLQYDGLRSTRIRREMMFCKTLFSTGSNELTK